MTYAFLGASTNDILWIIVVELLILIILALVGRIVRVG